MTGLQPAAAGISTQPADRCYQCHKCAAGCPMAARMDLVPSRVLRLIQFGDRERLLAANTPWLCAGCETCTVRCPNGIDIAAVMDELKVLAARAGVRGPGRKYFMFHRLFLIGLRLQGRLYELGLMGATKVLTLQLFSDLKLGLTMLLKGKLKVLPGRPRGRRDMAAIFREAARRRGEGR